MLENEKLITDYIDKQFREHANLVQSFRPALGTMMNEVIHPRTGKRITQNQKYAVIEKDRKNRVIRIIRKIEYERE